MNPSGNGQDFDSNNTNPNNDGNNDGVEVFSREDSSQTPENNPQPQTENMQQPSSENPSEQSTVSDQNTASEPQSNAPQDNNGASNKPQDNSPDEKPDFAMPQPEQNTPSQPEQPTWQNQPLQALGQPGQNQSQQNQPANAQLANTQPTSTQPANTQPTSTQPANKKPEKAQKPPKAKSGSHTAEIALIVAIFVIAAGAFGGGVFFWVQYNQLNSNVQSDRSLQVETAKKEQKDFDEKSHTKRTSSTTKEFTGPEDFGALNFQYSKDWNIFIANDIDDKPGFEAYFNPEYVQPVTSDKSTYAVHFKIQDENYDHVVSLYESNQDMQRIEFKNAQIPGVRYKGKKRNTDTTITEILIIKVNDKSAIFETNDYNTYQADFDNVITSLRNSNLSY